MKILLLLLTTLIGGCASMDSMLSNRGVIKSEVSAMSGVKSVWMTPALVGGPLVEFGLYWDSDKQDKAILNVVYNDAINFDNKKPIEFLIDGESFSYQPSGQDYGHTSIENNNYTRNHRVVSEKSYLVNKEFVQRLANAKNAHFRLWMLNGRYIETEVEYYQRSMQSFVPHSFNQFFANVWGDNSN